MTTSGPASTAAPIRSPIVNKLLSLALLLLGLVLFVWGIVASDDVGWGLSRLFTGVPTAKTISLLTSGFVLGLVGLAGVLRNKGS